MNVLSASTLLQRILFSPPFSHPVFQKVLRWALENFYLLINMGTLGYGIKQIVIDAPSSTQKSTQPPWMGRVYETLLMAQSPSREFFLSQGVFLVGSGIFGAVDALCNIGFFAAASQGLFALACCLALRYYISEVQSASTEPQKKSAILGILSSLGYILQAALWLTGAPSTVLIVIGALAIACTTLKFVMDIVYPARSN